MTVSEEDPREFFMGRILREAAAEGRPLTETERRYLERSETKDKAEYKRVEKAFDGENPDYQAFAERISGLVERAARSEMMSDPRAAARYREALKQLEKNEAGSALWFMVVPGVPGMRPALRRAHWIGLILGLGLVILGGLLGLYVFKFR